MKIRLRRRKTPSTRWVPSHMYSTGKPCWRRCCSPRAWTRFRTEHADGSTTYAPLSNWDRDPTTGQLWITCFCGRHHVLPMTLGEYHLAHPEVQA